MYMPNQTEYGIVQYIMRNPFSLEKMQLNEPDDRGLRLTAGHDEPADGCVIYRSGMNPKIHRNFEIFTPCDFIAAITQHIPDKSFQLLRYYGVLQQDARPARQAGC
jgi:hypothetical protein